MGECIASFDQTCSLITLQLVEESLHVVSALPVELYGREGLLVKDARWLARVTVTPGKSVDFLLDSSTQCFLGQIYASPHIHLSRGWSAGNENNAFRHGNEDALFSHKTRYSFSDGSI